MIYPIKKHFCLFLIGVFVSVGVDAYEEETMAYVQVQNLDHIVLNVNKMDEVLNFYNNVLGLQLERLKEYQDGKVPFPSVRINPNTIIDFFPIKDENLNGQEGTSNAMKAHELNHLCFAVEPTDMNTLIKKFTSNNIKVIEGPVKRFGARGTATSIYILDPEDRIIEIRHYGS